MIGKKLALQFLSFGFSHNWIDIGDTDNGKWKLAERRKVGEKIPAPTPITMVRSVDIWFDG